MTRRLGIALLITELNVGGAERALANLAVGLDPNEFEVQVYSIAPRPEASQAMLVDQIEQAGIAVHFLDARSMWQTPVIVRRLQRHLREQRPDVLLSFLYHANVIGGLAVRSMKQPPGHIASVRVAEPSRWRLRLERRFLRRAAAVACVSESLAEHVVRRQGLARGSITVIPNGIDPTPFDNAPPADLASLGIASERKLLTVIGRLVPQKGMDWLLDHIDPLLKRLPEFDLLIVGDGVLRAQLERRAASLDHAARIHFAGQRGDIPSILRRSSILLLPSRYEGMPNVVMEAMAASLPIASTRAEGVSELLGPLGDRQTFRFGDVSCFHKMVYEMATTPEFADELKRGNRERVTQTYPLARMVFRYAALIRSIV